MRNVLERWSGLATLLGAATWFVAGSIRLTVPSPLTTQAEAASVATPLGPPLIGIVATT